MCVCVCVCVCVYKYMCVCIYIYIYVCECITFLKKQRLSLILNNSTIIDISRKLLSYFFKNN